LVIVKRLPVADLPTIVNPLPVASVMSASPLFVPKTPLFLTSSSAAAPT
jgi:hypothetical protein